MRAFVLGTLLLTSACAAGTATPAFAPQLGIDLATMTKLPSGLYVQDLAVGEGAEAKSGNTVLVHYTGWLPGGRQFDTSRDAEPVPLVLGKSKVIQGWHEGIAGMRVGGKRRIVVPPHLGYGNRSAGSIPPSSTLVFELELLDMR